MIKRCKNCNIEFNGKEKQECCSRKCSNELKYSKIYVKCSTCGKLIQRTKSQIDRCVNSFCSAECKSIGYSKMNKGKNNPNFKNKSRKGNCSNCNKEIIITDYNKRYSVKNNYCSVECKAEHQKTTLLGENNPKYRSIECECSFCGKKLFKTPTYIKNRINIYCSQECKANWQSKYLRGENNPNFDNSISIEDRIIRRNFDGYAYWRREVYKRDNFTCQCCGDDKGGNIQAHHLNGYNWDIENRTNVDNGITLCEKCHKNFHNLYGCGDNTKKQFEEFLSNYINPVVNGQFKSCSSP